MDVDKYLDHMDKRIDRLEVKIDDLMVGIALFLCVATPIVFQTALYFANKQPNKGVFMAYDLKSLGDKLKDEGLEVAEESLI